MFKILYEKYRDHSWLSNVKYNFQNFESPNYANNWSFFLAYIFFLMITRKNEICTAFMDIKLFLHSIHLKKDYQIIKHVLPLLNCYMLLIWLPEYWPRGAIDVCSWVSSYVKTIRSCVVKSFDRCLMCSNCYDSFLYECATGLLKYTVVYFSTENIL